MTQNQTLNGYRKAVAELESRGIMPTRIPSLGPTKEALLRLSLKIDPNRVILVAGTNGKGTVCATLEALLLEAGLKVGLYTSPHLVETTERIRIQGHDITPELFLNAYTYVSSKTSELELSHFEMLTLICAWIFFGENSNSTLDFAIFEVGLGGTYDATNAIPHAIAVITQLGLDHQKLLGNNITEIAKNKLGIIPGCRLAMVQPLPTQVDLSVCLPSKSRVPLKWIVSQIYTTNIEYRSGEPEYSLNTPWGFARMALVGQRAAENMSLALNLTAELGLDNTKLLVALSKVRWSGRMSKLFDTSSVISPLGDPVGYSFAPSKVYLSGDHNVQGIESLVELLGQYHKARLFLLLGIGIEKDADEMLQVVTDLLPDCIIYLTKSPFKGRDEPDYGSWVQKTAGYLSDPMVAFNEICAKMCSDDLLVISGSLYLVGYFQKNIDILRLRQ